MTKAEFKAAAIAKGWREDRYGHLKASSPKSGKLYRLKLQKLAWRLEVKGTGSVWIKSRSAYYKSTSETGPAVHRVPMVPGTESNPPPTTVVVEKPDGGFLRKVLEQSLPTAPEQPPAVPAWLTAYRNQQLEGQ